VSNNSYINLTFSHDTIINVTKKIYIDYNSFIFYQKNLALFSQSDIFINGGLQFNSSDQKFGNLKLISNSLIHNLVTIYYGMKNRY